MQICKCYLRIKLLLKLIDVGLVASTLVWPHLRWNFTSDVLKYFVQTCLEPEPSQRQYVSSLMDSEFITMYKTNRLTYDVNKEIHLNEDGLEEVNCYKLQIAIVIKEIVHRHMTHNARKMKAVKAIESDFISASRHEMLADSHGTEDGKKEKAVLTVAFKIVKGFINH